MEAKRTARHVEFIGSFEHSPYSLANLLASPVLVAKKVMRRVKFTLKMNGGMLAGEVRRTNDGDESPSLLSIAADGIRVLMYVDASENRTVIRVMEGGGDATPRFYDLKRMTMAGGTPG